MSYASSRFRSDLATVRNLPTNVKDTLGEILDLQVLQNLEYGLSRNDLGEIRRSARNLKSILISMGVDVFDSSDKQQALSTLSGGRRRRSGSRKRKSSRRRRRSIKKHWWYKIKRVKDSHF